MKVDRCRRASRARGVERPPRTKRLIGAGGSGADQRVQDRRYRQKMVKPVNRSAQAGRGDRGMGRRQWPPAANAPSRPALSAARSPLVCNMTIYSDVTDCRHTRPSTSKRDPSNSVPTMASPILSRAVGAASAVPNARDFGQDRATHKAGMRSEKRGY